MKLFTKFYNFSVDLLYSTGDDFSEITTMIFCYGIAKKT